MATFPLHLRHTHEEAKSKKHQKRVSPFKPFPHHPLSEAIKRDRIVLQLLSRDGNRCYLCRRTFFADEYEIDHIIPSSRGGTDRLLNLAISCKSCNCRKRDHYVSISIAERMPCYWLS